MHGSCVGYDFAFRLSAKNQKTGSYDATVRLWDLRANSNEPIQVLNQAKDSVTDVRITPYGVLAGSVDGCVREYDIRVGLIRVDRLGSPVTCASVSHDYNTTLVSTLDGYVSLLDKSNGSVLSTYVTFFLKAGSLELKTIGLQIPRPQERQLQGREHVRPQGGARHQRVRGQQDIRVGSGRGKSICALCFFNRFHPLWGVGGCSRERAPSKHSSVTRAR